MLCKRRVRFVKIEICFIDDTYTDDKYTFFEDGKRLSFSNIAALTDALRHNTYVYVHPNTIEALFLDMMTLEPDACEPFLAQTKKLMGYVITFKGRRVTIRDCQCILGCLFTITDTAQDCIEKLRALWEYVRSTYGFEGRLSMTIGGMALVLFQNYDSNSSIWTPNSPKQIEYERLAYSGGKTKLYARGFQDVIEVYDVNSMYPAVMSSTLYPVHYQTHKVNTFVHDMIGVYRCTYRYDSDAFTFGVNGLSNSASDVFITSDEIEEITRLGGDVTVHDGYVYTRTGNPFTGFIHYTYGQKQLNGVFSGWIKMLMNSLYGKFAQSSEITRYELYNPKRHGIIGVTLIGDFVVIQETKKPRHQFYTLAALTTARARIRLTREVARQKQLGAIVVYCDTDSIHGAGIELPLTDCLGSWKRECIGEGIYLSEKVYAIQCSDGSTRIRHKGMHVAPDYETYKAVLNGTARFPYAYTYDRNVLTKTTKGTNNEHYYSNACRGA